jgi:hypothetical protein
MARGKLLAVAAIALIALAGCSWLFDFNAFSAVDKPAAPKSADYVGAAGLDKLSGDLTSSAVVSMLVADPTTTQQIVDQLVTDYLSGAVTTPDQQKAAIVYGDLQLKTTQGEAFVNNIVTTLMAGVSASATIDSVLKDIIPAAAAADATIFSNMVTALLDSNTQYLSLGAGLVDTNGNGTIDPGEGIPAGTNMGDVAQKAAVAYAASAMYDALAAAQPTLTKAEVITQMYTLATDPTSANTQLQNLSFDPFSSTNPDLPNVQNLLSCAGITLPGTI